MINGTLFDAPLSLQSGSSGSLTNNIFNYEVSDSSGSFEYIGNIFNTDASGHLIYKAGMGLTLSDNEFRGQASGIINLSDFTVDATGNDWGDQSDPSNTGGYGAGWIGDVLVLDSAFADIDNDGLGNSIDLDDDGDNYSDLDEIAAGSNPLDKNDVPSYAQSSSFMKGWRLAIPLQ